MAALKEKSRGWGDFRHIFPLKLTENNDVGEIMISVIQIHRRKKVSNPSPTCTEKCAHNYSLSNVHIAMVYLTFCLTCAHSYSLSNMVT